MTRTPAAPMLLDITAEVAGHLAVAVRLYRSEWAPRQGLAVPAAELHDIEKLLAARSMRGQAGSPLDELWAVRQAQPVSPNLTRRQAAARMACSESTVKRRVATGGLVPVRDRGIVRFRVEDVDAYMEDHRGV